jgi:hypothetical protein
VEKRLYNGDNTHRASKVRMSPDTCLNITDKTRYMALPQNKKLPQPPEGTTF